VFSSLGDLVNRAWLLILVGWVMLLVTLWVAAPEWNDVTKDGHFSFLPDDCPSRRGDKLFNQAFPYDLRTNSIVIVAARETEEGLLEDDLQFITAVLKPRLTSIVAFERDPAREEPKTGSDRSHAEQVVWRICAFDDEAIGSMLMSDDGHATLVVLGLTKDFFSRRNRSTIVAVERLLDDLRREELVPPGLDLSATGSAVVGREIMLATENSATAIGHWTIALAVALTITIFRAPLLALIPLLTMCIAMEVALKSLALLAGAGMIGLFKDIEAYCTVVVYASGIDYSLFLISRFQEELQGRAGVNRGLHQAIGKVGAAISASAATEVLGIGMLGFAEFGKFREAGVAIAFSLFIMLIAVLTLTPALLRVTGPTAFWPRQPAPVEPQPDSFSPTASECRSRVCWERIARAVQRRPGTFWLISTGAMAPFAVVGVVCYNHLNYGLGGNLPRQAASAHGTSVLERHFPAGAMGPVNLLIRINRGDFRSREGLEAIASLTRRLNQHREDFQITQVRSLAAPWGTDADVHASAERGLIGRLVQAGTVRRRALNYFITSDGALDGRVTRVELGLALDPFSEQAMDVLDKLEAYVCGSRLTANVPSDSQVEFSGSTASLRDLRSVGGRDRTRTNLLVTAGVFVVLVVLLRKITLTLYLLLTVLFSYLVTLGITFTVFYLADPAGFPGLDLTVPLFLFTLLIAVGADYNILLVTRVCEEEPQHGAEEGIATALIRTGPIISSCGFIMAGTFLSLMIAGQLAQMVQLGFALAVGVLVDTFVVRPILVPAYMLLLQRGSFGTVGSYLRSRNVRPRGRSMWSPTVRRRPIARR
jgi:RND superfamily putative drug exporter